MADDLTSAALNNPAKLTTSGQWAAFSRQICPHIEDHTDCPEGYIAWQAWAEKMAKTHRQRKCPGCGRYAIWEPKARPTPCA